MDKRKDFEEENTLELEKQIDDIILKEVLNLTDTEI